MFRSLRRLAVYCFGLVSSCFQLFATFGCSAHHHKDYQQHNRLISSSSQSSTTTSATNQSPSISSKTNKKIIQNSTKCRNGNVVHSTAKSKSKSSQTNNNQQITAQNKTKNDDINNKTIKNVYEEPIRPKIPFHMLVSNLICHATLIIFGHLNDKLRRMGWLENFERVERNRPGYTKLYNTFAPFYIRNIIKRMIDMWEHPICSAPSGYIDILERKFTPYNTSWKFTGRKLPSCINMGSYDYLGFSKNYGARIESVAESIKKYGVTVGTSAHELGAHELYRQIEEKTAKFLGVEDAIVIGMGFATNALTLPSFFGPGCLVISDEFNHASLALGCKMSGAKVHPFKHNDMRQLEKIIRESIINGQPKTELPWKKIVILVEGIYSMEGTIVNLPELIRIKKKYKCYLYMDEAHSIGAMGQHGRGICDYFGCDPRDVDILMGTFTKSFAAAGGYIAGKKNIIDYIRVNSAAGCYASTMSPPVCQQILRILDKFLSIDMDISIEKKVNLTPIEHRILQLKRNVHRFRQKLRQLGFHIDGNDDSPVVPVYVYTPTNLKCLIKKLLDKGVAVTGASFPVTKLTGVRARFCLSANHTDEMIDFTVKCLDEIGTEIGIKFDEGKIKKKYP